MNEEIKILEKEIKELIKQRDVLYNKCFAGNRKKNEEDKIDGLKIAELLSIKRKELLQKKKNFYI